MRVVLVASLVHLLASWSPAPVRAQGWDDEPAGGSTIVDPELEGVAPAPAEPAVPARAGGPSGEIRTVIRSRTGVDLRWQDPREDVLTSTQLVALEATIRPSEGTRVVLGVRPLHRFMTRREATSDAVAERFELDLLPGAAYVDLNPADGLHLRLGYQYLHLGRFDVLSATNVLAVSDLREGALAFPEAAELAQPAVRVDWDAKVWLSLQATYVPFFQPHVIGVGDGDYALFPSTQAQAEASIDDAGRQRLLTTTHRSGQEAIATAGIAALSPVADLSTPQLALRASAHGPQGELAATVALANERLPALWFSQSALDYYDDPTPGNEARFAASPKPFEIQYNRFAVASVDGATDLGPVQVGVELAYMFQRTFFAAAKERLPVPGRSDVAHAGLRLEYLWGREIALASEAFVAYALSNPTSTDRRWLMFDGGRRLHGALAFASYAPTDTGLQFELAGAALSGPSYAFMPRAELLVLEGVFVELGAAFLFGPKPTIAGDPSFSLAGAYRDTDQVFVGVRYLP